MSDSVIEQSPQHFVPCGLSGLGNLIQDAGQSAHLQGVVLGNGLVMLGRPRAGYPDVASCGSGFFVAQAPQGLDQFRPG
ncbi:MAG: hypothetical protein P4L11_07000 [Geothrix sp.]|nr:hypothetical protein [Geothrix sp.]